MSADDIIAIEQLLYRYCHLLDQSAVDEVVSLFAADGTLVIGWEKEGTYAGCDEIATWYAGYARRSASRRYMRHKIFGPWIAIDGDRATAKSYFDGQSADLKGVVTISAGRYEDELASSAGQWRFASRKIFVDDRYSP